MKNIKEYNLDELKQELISLGEKGYRAEQIFNWLYVEKVKSFDDMTNLSLELREKLKQNYTMCNFEILSKQESSDGTKKYLFDVLDGNATIINEKKKDLQLEFDIENYKANTILELPYIYYLGYTVTTGQNEKIQMFESDNGMLAIKLDENIESAHITVKYTGTIIEKVSYLISAISIITFIGYVIYSKKQDI